MCQKVILNYLYSGRFDMKKRLIICSIITAILLSACGASASSYKGYDNGYYGEMAATESAAEYSYETSDYAYDAAMPAEATGSVDAETVSESTAAKDSRKRITTVSIDAETQEYDAALDQVKSAVNAAGGYVESQDNYSGSRYYSSYKDVRYSDQIIRVPSDKLESFLSAINTSFNVTNYSQSEEDVTLKYVDLESRISSLKEEQKRLDELMAQADTVEELIYIEDRATDVRYELESYASQLRTYDNKINYATVNLHLREVAKYTEPEPETFGERIASGLAESLSDVGLGFVDFIIGLIISLPYIIVFLIIVGIIILIVRAIIKASRKKAAKKQAEMMANYQNVPGVPQQPVGNLGSADQNNIQK